MADEYIRRDDALKYIKSEQCKTCSDIGLCGNCAVLVAVRLLEKVPAADVAPVVHGKWGDNGIEGSMLVKCSVCGFDCGANSFSYCPNCGARMRKAKRGEDSEEV